MSKYMEKEFREFEMILDEGLIVSKGIVPGIPKDRLVAMIGVK